MIVYENDGAGNFTAHTIDQGIESHLGTQLADMDNDGDLDIVSIAWREPQYLHLWRNDAITENIKADNKNSSEGKPYYLPIIINGNGYSRKDKPVEIQLNFSELFKGAAINSSFSDMSLRMTEEDVGGEILNDQVPFQFDKALDFEAGKKALGTLVFLMQGNTAPNQSRYFRLYIDDKDHSQNPTNNLLSIQEVEEYEGYSAYKISTPTAEFYYHINSGGFSSIKDKEGNDWVSYHPNLEPESGFKGRFRGIPNIAPRIFILVVRYLRNQVK